MSIITGVIGIVFIFGIIIAIHEIGHFIFARISGMKVTDFALGMGPAIFSFKRGDTTYALRCIPFGGYVNIVGMEVDDADQVVEGGFNDKPWPLRFLTLFGGVLFNIILAMLLMFCVAYFVGFKTPGKDITITSVNPKSPAERAQLRSGDIIIGINDQPVEILELSQIIKNSNTEIVFNIERNGTKIDIPITPKEIDVYKPPQGWGAIEVEKIHGVGITMDILGSEYVTAPFIDSIQHSVFGTWEMFRLNIVSFISLFQGSVPASELGGPVAIMKESYKAASTDDLTREWIARMLVFTAFISFAVGLFNLFPIPGLDGGRLLFLVIELCRGGRPVNRKTEAIIHGVGLAFLFAFIFLVTIKDVFQLFTRGGS